MASLEERVAVLERVAQDNEGDIRGILLEIKEHMESEDYRWDEIIKQLNATNKRLDKYVNFVGGVIFSINAMWVFFVFAVKYIFKTKGGN